MCCRKGPYGDGTSDWKDCGYPWQRYDCLGADGLTCVDRCRTVQNGLPSGKQAKATWSSAKAPEGGPKRFECCIVPDTIPEDGECLPNCRFLYPGAGFEQCGAECCAPGHTCKIVQGKQKCVPCPNTCKPPRGKAICCEKGESCCFNDKTAACCGPEQTCRAHKVKQATCVCEKGKKCGTDCCGRDEECCGLGVSCCKKGRCCGTDCCTGSQVCCTDDCCDPQNGEFCLAKVARNGGIAEQCKKGCTAANKCGPYCCGTGTRCVAGRCVV